MYTLKLTQKANTGTGFGWEHIGQNDLDWKGIGRKRFI